MTAKKKIDERFKRFGTVSFTATTKVNDFIDYLEDRKIAGTKCNLCGKKFFPPRADCCYCLSSDINWFIVLGYGKLISYSSLEFAPRGFENKLPYSIALLDFGEYKIFGHLDESLDLSKIEIGMQMQVLVKHLERDQLSYVFLKA